jgi:MoaA/NifB/PqqE/SkfB family radical SAM enzyme
VGASGQDAPDLVGVKTWNRVLDELERMGVWKVVISGGEPFAFSGIRELMAHFALKRFSKNILTNGIMVTRQDVEVMKAARIVPMMSLDGAKAETHDRFRRDPGAFHGVMNAMSLLGQADVPFALTTVVHRGNQHELPAIAEMAYRHYAGQWTIAPLKALGRGRSAVDSVLDAADYRAVSRQVLTMRRSFPGLRMLVDEGVTFERYGTSQPPPEYAETPFGHTSCSAGTDTIVINWDGSVYPCMFAMQLRVGRVGTIESSSMDHIWAAGDWGVFRTPLRRGCRAVMLSGSSEVASTETAFVSTREGGGCAVADGGCCDGHLGEVVL